MTNTTTNTNTTTTQSTTTSENTMNNQAQAFDMNVTEMNIMQEIANNPYASFEQPSPFARKQMLSMIVPTYIRNKLGDSVQEMATNKVARTAIILRGMIDTVCSFPNAGRYITHEEALYAAQFETNRACNQNSRWGAVAFTAQDVLDKAMGMKLINADYTHTDKFISMCASKDKAYPHTEKQGRTQPYVKNNTRPCLPLKQALNTLYEEKYTSHQRMAELVDWIDNGWCEADDMTFPYAIRKSVKQLLQATKYVREGVKVTGFDVELMSQYDADNRARAYHMACAGANPQASDEERSYYALVNSGAGISKDHPSFKMFINEIKDIGGDFASDKMLLSIAANPSEFLILDLIAETTRAKTITWNGQVVKRAGKAFTMVRLAWDWLSFKETGLLHSSVGFGEDAKNSGTQYLAICAGSKDMAERTGLTLLDEANRKADPYVYSAEIFGKNLKKDKYFHSYADACDSRSFIKTPYMAVQYGGGAGALTGSKDYINNLIDMGFDVSNAKAVTNLAKMNVAAIKEALGPQITNFIENTQDAVEYALWSMEDFAYVVDANGEPMLDQDGNPIKKLATHLTYKHVDGFYVNHQTKPTVVVCGAFNINMGGGENGTKIADFGPKDGQYVIDTKSPTGEEFVRTFIVNFIQGLDALVARTVINTAKKNGLRGITSIHDCFRTCLEDSAKLHATIAEAYEEIFIKHDVVEELSAQLEKISGKGIAPVPFKEVTVTKEILTSPNAYYFCQ